MPCVCTVPACYLSGDSFICYFTTVFHYYLMWIMDMHTKWVEYKTGRWKHPTPLLYSTAIYTWQTHSLHKFTQNCLPKTWQDSLFYLFWTLICSYLNVRLHIVILNGLGCGVCVHLYVLHMLVCVRVPFVDLAVVRPVNQSINWKADMCTQTHKHSVRGW